MRKAAGQKPRRSAGYRAGAIMIGLTLAACLAALAFRTPIRSRYWAWQVVAATGVAERAAALSSLCNAGDAGRWGTETLLAHSDAGIRQFGVLVLQHVHSSWSRRRLLNALEDPSEAVAEMAALGLAIHGETSIIPELERLYDEADCGPASSACLALERLGAPEAVTALTALAARPADVVRRAALVDALAALGTNQCAAALLKLLADHRSCATATRAELMLDRLAPLAAAHGLVEAPEHEPASGPTSEPRPRTIAERAAEALARITGLNPPFSSDLSDEQRDHAESVWRGWLDERGYKP